MKFYEAANKSCLFRVFSIPKNGLEWIFECFVIRRIGSERNSGGFFSSKNDSEWNSEFFFL